MLEGTIWRISEGTSEEVPGKLRGIPGRPPGRATEETLQMILRRYSGQVFKNS